MKQSQKYAPKTVVIDEDEFKREEAVLKKELKRELVEVTAQVDEVQQAREREKLR